MAHKQKVKVHPHDLYRNNHYPRSSNHDPSKTVMNSSNHSRKTLREEKEMELMRKKYIFVDDFKDETVENSWRGEEEV